MGGGKARLAFVVAAALAVALTGCTDGGSHSQQTASYDVGGPPRPQKYDPPVELSTVGMLLNTQVYPPGDDMNNNEWTRYLRDQLGIVVKKRGEVPGDQLEQKTNVMIASGDIPDFFIATPKQLVLLESAGMIEPLTEVYAKQASPAVKDIIEQAGPEVMEAAKINGKLMGIPFTGVAKESVPVLWIREDWRTKLNLPQPNTMDDLLQISEAFTKRDPDGNGKADTYGLALDKNLQMALGLFNGFHAYKGIWIDDPQGKLVYGSIQPEMKPVLAKLQQMYASGQIDRDFGIKESGKVYQTVGENKIGIVYGAISAAQLYLQTPGSRWLAYPVPSADKEPAMVQHGLNLNTGFWVVKKGTEHPEAVLRMADEFIQLFYNNTRDDVYKRFNFDIATRTSIWYQAPVKLYKSFKNAEISAHLEPFLQSGISPTSAQKAALTPEEREKYMIIVDYLSGKSGDWSVIARNGLNGGGSVILDYARHGQMLPDRYYGLPTKTMVQKQANLQRMEDEVMTKIILGAPIDEFDRFIEDWHRLGGEQITNEVNEWAKAEQLKQR
ncbi:MAG: transporter substrate-binding protein [Paenibacillus sp.]|nr:transporter substrate-binding protein [Paenibacillus sp.]